MENCQPKLILNVKPPAYVRGWEQGSYYEMVFEYLSQIGAEIVIDADKLPSHIMCDGVTVERPKDPNLQRMSIQERLDYIRFQLERHSASRKGG